MRETDKETIPPAEKLAQFKLTDAQRLAFMTEERDTLLQVLRLLHAECMEGSPSLLTMEFAAKQIARAHNGRLAK